MEVMALFQLLFLQNACFQMKVAYGQGHLCRTDKVLISSPQKSIGILISPQKHV